MPRTDNEVRVTPSVLDRLLDFEPEVSREPLPSRQKSLRQLKQSMRRDLEWLLNTRFVPEEIPEELPNARCSVLAFGLPDFTHTSIKSPSDQSRITRLLAEAIEYFEPRLQDVLITVDPTTTGERTIHFRIDAQLLVEPAPEQISFDTHMHLSSGAYTVKEE